jgi:hypothetical protein
MEGQPRSQSANSEERMNSQNKKLTLFTFIIAATVGGLATPAFAQEPVPAAPAPVEVTHKGRMSGDIANGGLGVGAALFVSGIGGPQVVYDFGIWDIEGMFGFLHRPVNGGPNSPTFTETEFGISAWYHLHMGQNSDFSLGGGFGLINVSNGGGTAFEFEPGAQVRAFITPNVALSGRLAVILAFGDFVDPLNRQLALDGQITGGFGFTYFFR